MASFKEIRQALGISQQLMADYLSVSRDLYAQVEIDRRDLPREALEKLGDLEIHLATNASRHVAIEVQTQSEESKKMLLRYARKCEYLAVITNRKLELMRSQRQECLIALQINATMQEALPEGDAVQKDRLWLEIVELNLRHRLEACSIAAQSMLQWKAESFADHARKAREIML